MSESRLERSLAVRFNGSRGSPIRRQNTFYSNRPNEVYSNNRIRSEYSIVEGSRKIVDLRYENVCGLYNVPVVQVVNR